MENKVEDIWKQPLKGYTTDNNGRTEEQIVKKESEIGVKFPPLFRAHMKIQNGGYLWKNALNHNGDVIELLHNGSTIDPIIAHTGYQTLKQVLLEYIDKKELEISKESEFLNLDRLPVLSSMDGHTILCFDYGYRIESAYENPQIVYFELECAENGYEEKFRIESYDDLMDKLVYYGYESTSYFIGLKSVEPIEKIAERINTTFDLQLQLKTDDDYGWYNFEKWYYGEFKINSSLSAHLRITPNQSLSKTFLFQNNEDFDYILDIDMRIGVGSFQDNSNFLKAIIEEYFRPFLSSITWDFLLVPFHKENPKELEKIKKSFEEENRSGEEKPSSTKHGADDMDYIRNTDSAYNEKQKPWWKRFWP